MKNLINHSRKYDLEYEDINEFGELIFTQIIKILERNNLIGKDVLKLGPNDRNLELITFKNIRKKIMDIIVNETKVQIKSSGKCLNNKVDCLNCFGLVIDYSVEKDFYTVEFEYVDKNGMIDTDVAFLKKEDFKIIS